MEIRIDGSSSCPCNSGKAAAACCFRKGKVRPPPQCKTSPPLPRTGFSHPKCYASGLLDCSERITGEHYISRTLLELLAADSKVIKVRGYPWAPTEKSITPSNLESKILCDRHNAALSSLDDVAGRLFKYLLGTMTAGVHPKPKPLVLFNGHDFERWMLKVLCGVVTSGNAMHGNRRLTPLKDPPLEWLRILFYNQPLPKTAGLYFLAEPVGSSGQVIPEMSHAPLVREEAVLGNIITLNSLRFCLSMVPVPARDQPNSLLKDAIYRVESIGFTTFAGHNSLQFAWTKRGDGGGIEIALQPAVPSSHIVTPGRE